jgi:hypothetical protein
MISNAIPEDKLPIELLEVLEKSPGQKITLEKKGKIIYFSIPKSETLRLIEEAKESALEKIKAGWTREDFFNQFREAQKIIEQHIDE